jgi:ribosomal protein L37AE/L43A
MSQDPLICQNDDCRGKDFEQVSGNIWKCVYCGTATTLQQKIVKTKSRHKKERPAVKEYPPATFICEQCGQTIAKLHHPRDEKGFNETWAQHVCTEKTIMYT